ncbi:hypothetical protein VM1G_04157 [Cytospora mali]|uniref:Uncharacterized protein n=1 Tax=Cytospora mali TaxID=578113 RepID=A0A194VX60_CYTMA|nr:hypothetical protein VM1G_04157 [Valsa mali]
MSGVEEENPWASEKDHIQAHFSRLDHGLPPTPNSVLLGSPISLLETRNGIGGSSSHQQSHENPLTPPPYSGPSTSSQLNLPVTPATPGQEQQPQQPQTHPGLPHLDYRIYSPPLFELSSDCTTIKSTAPYLSNTVQALTSLVRTQSTVPPKPQVHITGRRGHRVDFAIKLNLMTLLVPEDPRQRMDYIRCAGAGEVAYRGGTRPGLEPDVGDDAGLEEWARRFVEDTSSVKTFVLERTVANLDTTWLEGQIRSLVASMAYRGVVTVTFPITHARVVVQNPDKVNKLFTGLTALFMGKSTYEVVKAVWPFATCAKGEAAEAGGARRCVVQSEEQWWKEWAQPIKFAIATRRRGWVTNEDKLEAIMEGKGKGMSTVNWGPSEEL